MEKVYDGTESAKEAAGKKRLLIFWLVLLAVVLATSVFFAVVYALAPLGTDKRPYIYPSIIISASFICFSVLFFPLKFNRVKRYAAMLLSLEKSLPESGSGIFISASRKSECKSGIEWNNICVSEFNSLKQEKFQRSILFDPQKPLPDFREGDRIIYKTVSNILIEYKITERERE